MKKIKEKIKEKNFNIVIAGVGGQGLITLIQIISRAAFDQGFDVKTSELHGLSQRGGSVETHLRFGKKVYSPLVSSGEADLILALEFSEGLRAAKFANKKTIFLANKNLVCFSGCPTEPEIEEEIKKAYPGEKHLILASDICRKEFGNDVVSGIYLLGFAAFNNFLPLSPESILGAILKVVPEKHIELNKKAFELARN